MKIMNLTNLEIFFSILKMASSRVLSSILILIVLIVGILLPLHINITNASNNGTASIFNLNVCYTKDSAMSVNADIPVLHECPCDQILLEFVGSCEVPNPTLEPLLIVFQKEHPPRV